MHTKSTPDLRVGDIVAVHGARLRLTEEAIDAEKAKINAEYAYELALWHARTPEERESIALRKDWDLTLRAFRTEYLGPVNPSIEPAIPPMHRHTWIVQGNMFAIWNVLGRE